VNHLKTSHDDSHAFVVEGGRYLSGRWPGDAYLIGKRLLAALSPADDRAARAASAPPPA
jgi:hypothetical protein